MNLSDHETPHEQFAPDCSQNSYLTLLDRQDAAIGDYTLCTSKNGNTIIAPQQRELIVSLISSLTNKKKYRVETFHVAVGIMDKFHSKLLT